MVPFEATELRFPGFLGRRSLRRRSTAKALSTYLMVFQLLLSGLSAVAYNSVKKNGLLSWLVVLVPSVLGCCIGVQLLTTRRSVLLGGLGDAAPRALSSSDTAASGESDRLSVSPGMKVGDSTLASEDSTLASDSTGAASESAAAAAAVSSESGDVATVEAPLLRLWQLRHNERGMVRQHGQSPPPPLPLPHWFAAPELGPRACSARARRVWLAQPSGGGGCAPWGAPDRSFGSLFTSSKVADSTASCP